MPEKPQSGDTAKLIKLLNIVTEIKRTVDIQKGEITSLKEAVQGLKAHLGGAGFDVRDKQDV
jgi:hypothetical protein